MLEEASIQSECKMYGVIWGVVVLPDNGLCFDSSWCMISRCHSVCDQLCYNLARVQ